MKNHQLESGRKINGHWGKNCSMKIWVKNIKVGERDCSGKIASQKQSKNECVWKKKLYR